MNKSLVRKITYILSIIVLLLPLYALGRPKSGAIAQLRNRHDMGQTYLGQLDPTSESMRLATLGMRGIASSILWLKADYYKEEKYFDRFSATLNQIALLQPHFISVWQHQAHNLSYNVSPEFEDYRQRYEWVKKGIDYLVRGTKFNERKPILEYDLGYYVGNKLGKADENRQYRDLFRRDTEFHNYFVQQGLQDLETDALGFDQRPDNWRVGKLWYNAAVRSFERGNKLKKSPHFLYSSAPLWQMYYAEAIQTEGILDDRSRFAWEQGGREWTNYGNVGIPWSGDDQIKLLESETLYTRSKDLLKEFEDLTVDARKKARDKRWDRLSDEMKAAYDKPEGERNAKEYSLYVEAVQLLKASYQEIVGEAPQEIQGDLLQRVNELSRVEEKLRITNSYRGNVNFAYWETRAKAEQKQYTVDARRLVYEADQMIDSADIKGAVDSYEKAWVLWDRAFRRFPILMTEEVGEAVYKSLNRYKKLIEEDLGDDFVLAEFMRFRRAYNADSLDFNVEKALADWTARSATMEDDQDYFESEQAAYFNIRGKKAKEAEAAAEKESKEPATDPAATAPKEPENMENKGADAGAKSPETPPASESQANVPATNASGDAGSNDSSGRPPRLENPDSP